MSLKFSYSLWEIPVTFAPNSFKNEIKYDPLKPVCPVTIIFLFLNFFFKIT